MDDDSQLTSAYEVTTSSVHDSQVFKTKITKDDAGATVWDDSAFVGLEYQIHSNLNKVECDVHEKAR